MVEMKKVCMDFAGPFYFNTCRFEIYFGTEENSSYVKFSDERMQLSLRCVFNLLD